MCGTVPAKSCIMIGRYGICEAFVCFRIKFGKGEAFFNDCLHMQKVMCLVKLLVPGDNLCLNVEDKCLGYHVSYSLLGDKVTTKKRNAERYSDRIELQGFQSCFRLFVKPSQSPLKPNQDAATLLVRNHARNGDKRTRITKQGVKD